MRGAPLAERVREQARADAAELGSVGLATVLVGDDPASHVYVTGKHTAAVEAGFRSIDQRLPADVAQADLLSVLDELNRADEVDGILVQTPLPDHIDEGRVMRALDPIKDVDGLHPFNAGQLFFGRQTLVGATPVGIMELLDEYRVPVAGARAVVVGRSLIVGRPISMLLLHENATVTICHSRTEDLAAHTRAADILVAAVGSPGLITAEMVKPGAAVIDVGITRTERGLLGDVDPGVAEVAGFLTPVPGGVGPMTIAALLGNTVRAARFRHGSLAFPQV